MSGDAWRERAAPGAISALRFIAARRGARPVRDFEGSTRTRWRSHDVTSTSASAPFRPPAPEERLAAVRNLARDIDQCAQLVRDDVDAIRAAEAAQDMADRADAARDAQDGLARL